MHKHPDNDVPPPVGSYARSVMHKHPDTDGTPDVPYSCIEAHEAVRTCQGALNYLLDVLQPPVRTASEVERACVYFARASRRGYPVDIDGAQ